MSEIRDPTRSGRGSRSSTGTSRSLIDRVRADDAGAWERLVALYAPLVAHWCRRWRLSDADTADVFQEVFHSVATHLAEFRNDRRTDTFRGWLRIITLNKLRDHARRQSREPRGTGGSEALERLALLPAPGERVAPWMEASLGEGGIRESSPGEDASHTDAAIETQLFRRALDLIRAEFEPRTWQAFWRTAIDGREAKDVAADLAMSPGAVRVAKSRVLQRLRAELGDVRD